MTSFVARLGVTTLGAYLCWAGIAEGEDPVHPDHTLQRAGNPQLVSPRARPSDTGAYCGYYVGGGSPCRGDAPTVLEGTWGWDYEGWCLCRIINLGWWHGRRSQGGTGAYKPDGPHLAQDHDGPPAKK